MSEKVHAITSLKPKNSLNALSPRERKNARLARTMIIAGGLAAGTAILASGGGSDKVKESPAPNAEVCYSDQNTKLVTVKDGDGVDQVIQRAWGVDDGRAVLNNDCYEAEVAAIIDQNNGSDMLQPGKIHLPVDIYPEDKLPQ